MQEFEPDDFEIHMDVDTESDGERGEKTEGQKERRRTERTFFRAMLLTMIIILSGYLIFYVYDYYHDAHYSANQVIEELPAPTPVPLDIPVATPPPPMYDNQVATLTVDGVDITDAPIMQHPTDDDYYLTHNEDGQKDALGAYFVYHDWNMSAVGKLDKVIVIFGHSNGNSIYRRFSVLKNFRDADFARQYQYMYLTVGGVKTRWKIFAVSDYPVANNYVQANPSDDFLEWEIGQMKATSYNQYTVPVSAQRKILILSTCTGIDNYETRFIVCAVYDGIA